MTQQNSLLLTQEQLEKLIAGVSGNASVAQATGVTKEYIEGLYSLAHGLYTSENYRDALVVFQALTLYDNLDLRFWMGLGGCRQALGQYEGAIEAYQMGAVAGLLKNPEPMFYAVTCLMQLGRRDEALVGLEAVMAMGKDDPRYDECRSKAEAIMKLLKGEK